MSALLLGTIALLIGSLIGSIVLWIRSGETRVGLLGGMIAVFAVHQGIELWSHWGTSLAIDAAGASAIAGLFVSLLCVGIVVALSRTLKERDRVETIHWDSMEAVRVMNELSANPQLPFETKVAKLLEAAKKRFEMEIAMFASVSNEVYEVLAVDAPPDFPVARGAVLPLAATYCEVTIEAERPIAVERITDALWIGTSNETAFDCEAYLGAAVRVGGIPYGTLCFASSSAREGRFSGTEKDLIQLMAQWLGTEIERRDGAHIYVEPLPGTRTATASPTNEANAPSEIAGPSAGLVSATWVHNARELNANRMLQRVEKQLRTALGDEIALSLKFDPNLGLADVSRVPIDAIIRTLVMNAKDAMGGQGELVIETANLELAAGEPGVIPAVAPDRYVTITVSDTGPEPDADTLARLYEPPPNTHDPIDIRDPRARMSLSIIYRLLQSCGGDLSVDVEKGRGSTFTVYLPRAKPTQDAPSVAPSPATATYH